MFRNNECVPLSAEVTNNMTCVFYNISVLGLFKYFLGYTQHQVLKNVSLPTHCENQAVGVIERSVFTFLLMLDIDTVWNNLDQCSFVSTGKKWK